MLQSIELSVCLLSIVMHLIALSLLLKLRKTAIPNRTQRVLLIHLSVSETCFMLCQVVKIASISNTEFDHYISIIQMAGFDSMYYFAMIYLTADRFFEVYLNLRYPLYWNETLARNVLLVLWFVSAVMATVTFFLYHLNIYSYMDVCYLVLYPSLEIVFLVVATITYSYIIRTSWRFYRKTRRVCGLRDHPRPLDHANMPPTKPCSVQSVVVPKKQRSSGEHSFQRKLLLPTLLILTFVIFMVIPDMVYMFQHLSDSKKQQNKNFKSVIFTAYFIAFTLDAIIYIFLYPPVRKLFLRILFNMKWK